LRKSPSMRSVMANPPTRLNEAITRAIAPRAASVHVFPR